MLLLLVVRSVKSKRNGYVERGLRDRDPKDILETKCTKARKDRLSLLLL